MTEDNELIEIMARAFVRRWEEITWEDSGAEPKGWEAFDKGQKYIFRDCQSAALTAYRNHEVEL